jgi:hypothetical protein
MLCRHPLGASWTPLPLCRRFDILRLVSEVLEDCPAGTREITNPRVHAGVSSQILTHRRLSVCPGTCGGSTSVSGLNAVSA